jgi:hypothetical protein
MQRIIAEGVADSRFIIFGQSSHLITMEREADAYLDVVAGFLERAAKTAASRRAD